MLDILVIYRPRFAPQDAMKFYKLISEHFKITPKCKRIMTCIACRRQLFAFFVHWVVVSALNLALLCMILIFQLLSKKFCVPLTRQSTRFVIMKSILCYQNLRRSVEEEYKLCK